MNKIILFAICASLFVSAGCATKHDSRQAEICAEITKGPFGLPSLIIAGSMEDFLRQPPLSSVNYAIKVSSIAGYPDGSKNAEYIFNYKDWITKCICHAKETNTLAKDYRRRIKERIKPLDSKIKKLVAAYKKQEVSEQALQRESQYIAWLKYDIERFITILQKHINEQKIVIAEAREFNRFREADIIEDEITKIESHIAKLHEEKNKLLPLSLRLSI